MGKFHQIGNIIVRVYANDHLPPHLHAISPDFQALIEIETLAVLAGSLEGAQRRKVMAWADANIDAIRAEWTRINPRFPVSGIVMNDIRISRVEAISHSALSVAFKGSVRRHEIELGGWIATGGGILAPLRAPDVFAKAALSDHGAAVTWDDGEGDLSIDAFHLRKIADEQKSFSNEDLRQWQSRVNISNAEAADFVGVSPSTWATYRVDAKIPQVVAMTLRAAERDPLLLQAHLRPRLVGRPRKDAGRAMQ